MQPVWLSWSPNMSPSMDEFQTMLLSQSKHMVSRYE
jgi:hypothetical protein